MGLHLCRCISLKFFRVALWSFCIHLCLFYVFCVHFAALHDCLVSLCHSFVSFLFCISGGTSHLLVSLYLLVVILFSLCCHCLSLCFISLHCSFKYFIVILCLMFCICGGVLYLLVNLHLFLVILCLSVATGFSGSFASLRGRSVLSDFLQVKQKCQVQLSVEKLQPSSPIE